MKKYFLIISVLFLVFSSSHAQDFSVYQKKLFVKGKDTLPYRLLLPENYNAKKTYPLILFLHGRGESGTDNEKQLVHGADLFLKPENRKKYPAIVLFPQCTETSFWSNVDFRQDSVGIRTLNFLTDGDATTPLALTQQLIYKLMKQFPVNKKQVYVMGLSMGGMGTFEMVRRNQNLFAAAMPICGGANPGTAKYLKKTNWWIFHGAKDDVVNPALSQKMADALKKENAKVKFTLYPEANHNSWDSAFAEPTFLSWLFAQHK